MKYRVSRYEQQAAREVRDFVNQLAVPGTPGRIVPDRKIQPKRRQSEKPLALELVEIDKKEPKLF